MNMDLESLSGHLSGARHEQMAAALVMPRADRWILRIFEGIDGSLNQTSLSGLWNAYFLATYIITRSYDIIYIIISYDIILYYIILYDIIWYYMIYIILYDLWEYLESSQFMISMGQNAHHHIIRDARCLGCEPWPCFSDKESQSGPGRPARHPSEVHLKSIWKRRSVHQTPSSILESVIFGYFGYKLLTVWICTAACSHHHTPVMRRIWDSRHLWLQCCGRTYKNGWFPSNWCHFQGWNLSTIVKIC